MKSVSPQKAIFLSSSHIFGVKLEPSWFTLQKFGQISGGSNSDSRNTLLRAGLSWQIRFFGITLFVSVIAFLILGLITALNSIGSRNQSNTDLAQVNELSRVALRVKFLAAELNGWQTAYAFDIVRGSNQALLEVAPARAEFLSSSRALAGQLSLLGVFSQVLTLSERQQLQKARNSFQEISDLDEQIIQMYRSGDPALAKEASELVLGREINLFKALNTAGTTLAAQIARRAESETNKRQSTDRILFTRLILFFGVALVGILVFSVIVWNFWQQRAKLLSQLEKLARTDSLTNLTNRRAWNEEFPQRLERARRNQQPLTVAMIDLDHFKRFNDTFGHLEGDVLLHQMGDVLRSSFRLNDFIARYGGEEFVVAFENCTLEQAGLLLERVRESMPHGQTFSAGITETDGTQASEVVLDRADKAMYQAKQNGRNRVQVSMNNVTLILEAGTLETGTLEAGAMLLKDDESSIT